MRFVAVAVAGAGLATTPLLESTAQASTPDWIGSVEIIQTQVRTDPDNPLRFTYESKYTQAPTATGDMETTFTASYDFFAEWYTTFPERTLVRRTTGVGSGDGVGGSVDVSYGTSEPSGYFISGSYAGSALFDLTTVIEDFYPSTSRDEVTAPYPGASGGAFLEAPADDQWVLQGTQVNDDYCTDGLCVTNTTIFSLRRADCTGAPDVDGDGLNVCDEFDFGSDPGNPDTDGGGLNDGAEFAAGTNPNDPSDDLPDADGDGLPDVTDQCPADAGPASTQGCPDTDSDGIPDSSDECPAEPGPSTFAGCPDTDGDGFPDLVDQCPADPAPSGFAGCPDADVDGVLDQDDQCPSDPGPASTQGCPDGDGDGVADSTDDCPSLPGDPRNNGCPGDCDPYENQVATDIAEVLLYTGHIAGVEQQLKIKDLPRETRADLRAVLRVYKELLRFYEADLRGARRALSDCQGGL